MGHAIEALAAERGHEVTVKIDKDDPWPIEMDADVAIEFTMPATAVGNMLRCLETGFLWCAALRDGMPTMRKLSLNARPKEAVFSRQRISALG